MTVKIAVVGCGYVADHYMETLENHPVLELLGVTDKDASRAQILHDYYGVPVYGSLDDVLSDPKVQVVVNLTDPESHYEVSKAALEAGKHVYSEKPLSVHMDEARELVQLAKSRGLLLSSAPCSILSEAAQTLWKAVRDGAVGKVRVVYAELDDNPIYLMKPEGWSNERGVPWPYLNEYETGCTLEHAGYYLTWLCAMFGPAKSITAFSSCVVPDKTQLPLSPPDTPDLSIACIQFHSGVVARLTCSIVAPYDHRLRIVGDEGVLGVDECWHYGTPVYLERFSQLSLNARKARSVRGNSFMQNLFGVGGRQQILVKKPLPNLAKRWAELMSGKRSPVRAAVKALSKNELVSMDFFRGVAEMAYAIEGRRNLLLSADFVLHVNELTLAMQSAGTEGKPYEITTTFAPLTPLPSTVSSPITYGEVKQGFMTSMVEAMIAKLHRH